MSSTDRRKLLAVLAGFGADDNVPEKFGLPPGARWNGASARKARCLVCGGDWDGHFEWRCRRQSRFNER